MWMGIRKHVKWGRYIVLKGMSELETNKLEEYDKKPWHSHKKPNKGIGK
jgi:hypothetical protein